MEYRTATVKCT